MPPRSPEFDFVVRSCLRKIQLLLQSSDVSAKCKSEVCKTQEVIRAALYKYPTDTISISFNGGKDCLVMLIILLAELYQQPYNLSRFPALYVKPVDSFPEVDYFVTQCTDQYSLNTTVLTLDMKSALTKYLDQNPRIQAILIGIRKNDPFGDNLEGIQPTDHGWAKVVRIQPILNWDYAQIWEFLLKTETPYCELYDRGYTSLGGQSTTKPNPELKTADGYLPAYKLKDGTKERSGRYAES